MTNPDEVGSRPEEMNKLNELFTNFIQSDNDDEKCEIIADIEHQFALTNDIGLDISEYYKFYVELLEEDGDRIWERFTSETGITREDLKIALNQITNKSKKSD